ncbi:hypothetical protein PR048_013058 [Dryococelus australis]|uniref:DUF659 domain-containing protein n=1 Tax=Dryococelus australis TaxID=614101 RepID=A0ABQ9HR48_9NEOP|nr:hypothetical protein PR048_013058 [Dryococelus australis]
MSDGWTDIKGNLLLNFVFVTPAPVFLTAIETKTKSHTAQYMAEVIDTVGSEKVHGVVADHAANMKLRNNALDDDVFWTKVSGIVKLLKPVTDAITKLETDTPISVKLHQHLKKLNLEETVHQSPLNRHEEELINIFRQRKEFCFHPVQHAACLLDSKQKGSMLIEEETSVAIQTISDIAETITDVDAIVVLGNLAEYKAENKSPCMRRLHQDYAPEPEVFKTDVTSDVKTSASESDTDTDER